MKKIVGENLRKAKGSIEKVSVSEDQKHHKATKQKLTDDYFTQIAGITNHVFWLIQLKPEQVLYVSPSFERVWGRPASELYIDPRLWTKTIHPDDRERVNRAFNKWLRNPNHHQYQVEYRIIRPDGSISWISDSGNAIRDDTGRICRMAGVAEEVTERKKIEDALQKERDRLAALISSISDEIWFADPAGQFTLVNPPGSREFDLDANAATDVRQLAASLEVLRPDGSPRAIEEAPPLRALRGETVKNEEEMVRTPATEEWRCRQVSASPVRDSGGNIIGSVSVVRDITERKQSQEQIENLSRFPEENPFPVLRIGGDGMILYSNKPGQVLLEQWNCKIGQKAPEDWCKLVSKTLKSKRYLVNEVNCGKRIFSFAVAPVTEAGYVNLYGQDITKRKQYEKRLRQSRDVLEMGVRERTEQLTETIQKLQEQVTERLRTERLLRLEQTRLDALFNLSRMSEATLNELTGFTLEQAIKLTQSEIGFIGFLSEDETLYTLSAVSKDVVKDCRVIDNPIQWKVSSTGVWGDAIRQRKTLFINDYSRPYPSKKGIPEGHVPIERFMVVPVFERGKIVVICGVGNKESNYDASDERQITLLLNGMWSYAQRNRASEAIQAEKQRLNDVLETLPSYVCLLTPDYRMPFANRVFRETFGYLPDKKCYEFLFNRTQPCEDCQTFTVFKTNKPHRWEWTGPNHRDYSVFDLPFKDTDGSRLILEMGIDITEQKRAEKRNKVTTDLLEQFAQKTSRKEYLDSVVEIIRDWSGCKCVGIRLTNSDGYIPYASCVGFSEEFLSLESNLRLKKDNCACIHVVAQTPQLQDDSVMTEKGSFRCDNIFSFVDSLSEKEKKRFCGDCLKAGFASVAVVPVRYGQNILGAIHIADEGENKVPLETVNFLEDMAALIGEAIHRFKVEESLLLNKQRLLDAQRITHLGNWEWDIVKNKLWWSDEVYRIFGLEPQQFSVTYDAFLSCVHPDDRKLVKESINKALYEGRAYNIDHRIVKPDGSEQTVNERAEVIYDSNRKPVKMSGTLHDITERKKAEDEIRENQRELRALTAELQLVEEKERRKIAQDLHDSIGQILAFSKITLKSLEKTVSQETARSLKDVSEQLDNAIKQARTLSFDLSPSSLYVIGFEAAIEDLVAKMSKERKIRCQFENCSMPKPLAEDVKILIYRIVRELLINVAKHANAELVKVSLSRSGSEMCIKVEDDGEGFDVSVLNSGLRKGFGLFSIRERLNHIGGRLKIDSAKGKGTRAILTAPLDIEEEDKLGVDL